MIIAPASAKPLMNAGLFRLGINLPASTQRGRYLEVKYRKLKLTTPTMAESIPSQFPCTLYLLPFLNNYENPY